MIAERIAEVCRKQNNMARGVFPPQVCPFCMGCPIGTVVVGVSDNAHITEALPIPQGEDGKRQINEWLDGIEAKLTGVR